MYKKVIVYGNGESRLGKVWPTSIPNEIETWGCNAIYRDGYVDGLALNTQFKGDIDIIHMSFGDTEESIGERYVTDLISDSRMTISAH